MADFQNMEKEAFLFAEDLFSDIIFLHPMFRVHLPKYSPTPTKSSHFTRAVSKSVIVIWHKWRNDLKLKFRKDFNSFSKGDAALKVYLKHLCGIVREVTTCKIRQVLDLSAILLELIAFLYERTYTHFLSKAPVYWLLMFKIIAFNEFYEVGGWKRLTDLSKKLESDFDNNEIYGKYFDSMPRAQPVQGSEKGSNSTKALSDIDTDFASKSVITAKAELDIVSKDKIGTDFESEMPSNDPVIPKTPEQTKQFFEKMIPEDTKALDSKEQEGKMVISESPETLLEKKDAENISPRPEDASKKSTVSVSESSSSAQTDKFSMPGVVKKEPDSNPKTSKHISPKKDSSKSDSIPSTTPKKHNPSKIDSVPVSQALPVEQGATSTVTSASGQRAQPGSEKGFNSTKALSSIKTDFASSWVIIEKAELDIVSKDKIGTDFESEMPSTDPIIPETPEQTKQFFEEMTLEDKKALDSKEQEGKIVISESSETLLEKKDAENISPRPEDASKSDSPSKDPVNPMCSYL